MEEAVPKCKYSCVNRVLLSSFYLAPVEYYAALLHADSAQIEVHDTYQKQSYRNRCIIAGANGSITLSIPVEKPKSEAIYMKDVRISEHGNWRHLHWNAILSAYNSTPFFQYYEDDFRPFYEEKITFLHDFNERLRRLVCHLIGIETPISYTARYTIQPKRNVQLKSGEPLEENVKPEWNAKPKGNMRQEVNAEQQESVVDLRNIIHPKRPSCFPIPPYYQVFKEKFGFLPNLSILDLLFNLGNESRLYLTQISIPRHFFLLL